MATWDDIRTVALSLPGAGEISYHGDPWFTMGSKGFVQASRGRCLMKLEKHHQELLFEARPDSDACGWNSGMRNSADNRLLQPIALALMLA